MAWAQNGWPADDERLLTASLRRAGIKPEHHGHPGVAQRWWWRAPGDTRPIGAEIRTQQCTGCGRVLDPPRGTPLLHLNPTLPRPIPTRSAPTHAAITVCIKRANRSLAVEITP
jgi:hypothetical protein